MDGHGSVSTRYPPPPLGTGSAMSFRTSTPIPGRGRWAEPGFVAVTPGSGEIMMAPVSVCHQVSTMGQRSWPMTRRYHIHASGLMGSPTEPRRRSELRSWASGYSSPHFMQARMAVGAV